MRKITSVHLADKMFQIEDDAYAYLNNMLTGQSKKKELEIQVAEYLSQKLNDHKQVITFPDVADVLYQLGFSASAGCSAAPQPAKRLYRRVDTKMIAGICSGAGDYFNIDPVIVRIIFVMALFGGVGFLLYIILWIIIPKAPKMLNS